MSDALTKIFTYRTISWWCDFVILGKERWSLIFWHALLQTSWAFTPLLAAGPICECSRLPKLVDVCVVFLARPRVYLPFACGWR